VTIDIAMDKSVADLLNKVWVYESYLC